MGFGKIKMDMLGNRSRTIILALFLAMCAPLRGAQLYYSPVTVNSGQVPSTQTDFPMLVSYTDARFKTTGNGGHVANANGYDIRPYSDSALTTALTYELERYNASTGEVIMWVKRSSLADGNVTYIGYGDTSLTTDGSSGSGTFSNSFLRVLHLKDGTTLDYTDSTGNDTYTCSACPTVTSGQIDGAATFASASSQYVLGSNAINPTAMTITAWINATSFPGAYNAVFGHNNANAAYSLLMVNSAGKLSLYNNRANYDGTGSHTLSTGTWYHVAMTYDNSAGLVGYVNAASDGTAGAGGTLNANRITYLGKDEANGRYWNGKIDEARIASVARSANWITTEYNNTNAPSTFATLGTEVGLTATQRGWFMFLKK